MNLSAENILLFGSILLFLSIIASKTSFKLGIPTLILFLVVGIMAGSEGLGKINFEDPAISQFLGMVALTFILFSGGLDTKWESIKPVLGEGLALSTLGVLITALLVGWLTSLILDITLLQGFLVGAIVSSTDAAAVFSILRSRNVGLKGHIRPLLEFESGSNDPMAYFLTVSLIFLVQNPDASIWTLIPRFFQAMALGGAFGFLAGKAMIWMLNKINLDIRGLYPVLVLSLVFFTFSFTDSIGGNGFLAIYIAGIMLGSSNFIHKKSLIKFYDGQAWLMQIIMFLTLGLFVFPSRIIPIMIPGVLISLFLILVARPVAVFLALSAFPSLNFRTKLFISWVGLRGAAPIVFATYPLIAGISYADVIFHLVFFISVISVLLQGTTLSVMAKLLHVQVPEKIRRKFPLDIELENDSKSELLELDVHNGSPVAGKAIVQLELPKNALIVLIHRNKNYMTASGDTVLQAGDHLLVLTDNKDTAERVTSSFYAKEES